MAYDNDVFDVILYDKAGNELYRTVIATFDRVTDYLADKCVESTDAWRAEIYGQHYQSGTVDLQALRLRAFREGYLINI